jgi:type I restriction enzyme R subunit
MDGNFSPFGQARHRIQRKVQKAYEMYFALYQALDVDKEESELYKEYPADFFDYVIIDECHRGGANEQSNWREILNHFSTAVHVGIFWSTTIYLQFEAGDRRWIPRTIFYS